MKKQGRPVTTGTGSDVVFFRMDNETKERVRVLADAAPYGGVTMSAVWREAILIGLEILEKRK